MRLVRVHLEATTNKRRFSVSLERTPRALNFWGAFPFRAQCTECCTHPHFFNHTPHVRIARIRLYNATRARHLLRPHFRTRSLDSVDGHFMTMSMTRTRQRPAATQVLQHADEKAEIWRPRGSEGGAGCCALNVVSSAKPQQAWRPRLRQRVGQRGEQGGKPGLGGGGGGGQAE